MLILARKVGESIQIGDNIKILIADSDNKGFVKIGIEAPKNITVHREEVYRKISLENKQALHRETATADILALAKMLRDRKKQ